MLQHPKPIHGFTLLEILVALAVFGLVGTALLHLFQSGLEHIERSQHRTQAVLFAQSLFTQLRTQSQVTLGTRQGAWGNTYRWQLQLKSYEPGADTAPDLVSAILQIEWGTQGRYETSTLLLAQSLNDS